MRYLIHFINHAYTKVISLQLYFYIYQDIYQKLQFNALFSWNRELSVVARVPSLYGEVVGSIQKTLECTGTF